MIDTLKLAPDANSEILRLLELESRLAKRTKIESYYPETGPLRRELYPKHLQFFEAGVNRRERAFLAANRVGKSEGVGGFELTLHLTGRYPAWWKGRRFSRPITAGPAVTPRKRRETSCKESSWVQLVTLVLA